MMNSAVTPCSLPILIAFVERHFRSLSSRAYLGLLFKIWEGSLSSERLSSPDYRLVGCTGLVGWTAYLGTSLFVTCKYLRIRATFSLVLMKQASGVSMSFNFGTPVAARVETIRGLDSFVFLSEAIWRAVRAYLISLNTSPACPGSTHTKIRSHSWTTLSLLNSATIPNSSVNGLNKWGYLELTRTLKLLKLD
jgi:hypothetical protein